MVKTGCFHRCGPRVQSLTGELRSCKLCSMVQTKQNKNETRPILQQLSCSDGGSVSFPHSCPFAAFIKGGFKKQLHISAWIPCLHLDPKILNLTLEDEGIRATCLQLWSLQTRPQLVDGRDLSEPRWTPLILGQVRESTW